MVRDRHNSLSRGSPQPPFPFFNRIPLVPNIFLVFKVDGKSVWALRADLSDVSAFRNVEVSVPQFAFL
jgi:hypothetical protein